MHKRERLDYKCECCACLRLEQFGKKLRIILSCNYIVRRVSVELSLGGETGGKLMHLENGKMLLMLRLSRMQWCTKCAASPAELNECSE